jgi:hypothetical protein
VECELMGIHWFWASHQWTISPKARTSFQYEEGFEWFLSLHRFKETNLHNEAIDLKSMEWRAIQLHANNSITHPLTHPQKKIQEATLCLYCCLVASFWWSIISWWCFQRLNESLLTFYLSSNKVYCFHHLWKGSQREGEGRSLRDPWHATLDFGLPGLSVKFPISYWNVVMVWKWHATWEC